MGILACVVLGTTTRADNTWTGSVSSTWEMDGNWASSPYPSTNAGNLTLGSVSDLTSRTVTCNSNVTDITNISTGGRYYTFNGTGSWTIADGGTLSAATSGGDTRLFMDLVAQGDLTVSSATVDSNYHYTWLGDSSNRKTITLSAGKILTLDSQSRNSLVVYSAIVGSGTLRKTGNDITVLCMATPFQGAIAVDQGSLAVIPAAVSSSTDVTIASGATLTIGTNCTIGSLSGAGSAYADSGARLTIAGSADTTFSGTIMYDSGHEMNAVLDKAGSGTLTMSGLLDRAIVIVDSGALILTGSSTYTGATTINGGTFQVGDGTTNGTLSSTSILNNGNFAFQVASGATQTYSGQVTGTGSFTKGGTGTLILSGSNTFSGGTTVNAGLLRMANDNALGNGSLTVNSGGTLDLYGRALAVTSISGAGAIETSNGAATLSVNNATDCTFSGSTTGPISLAKSGAGTLVLTGVNGLSGTTTVAQGELKLNGSLAASAVTVDSGATLSGNGTVGSLTTAGTVSPGNSIGTINVLGNYVQSGGTYTAEINSSGQSDLIHATGTATINGGTLAVVGASGTYHPGTTYNLLVADGGVTAGSHYDNVTINLPFLTATLQYGSNDIEVTVTRNATDFASIANTRNQRATATYLDSLSTTATGDLADVLETLSTQTAPDARAAFDAMSGEPYADLTAINFEASNMFTDAVHGRLWNHDTVQANGGRLWADAIGNWQRQRPHATYAGYDKSLSGFLIGYDWQGDGIRLGVASGFGRSGIGFLGSPATADVQLFNASLYGQLDFDALYVAAVTGYTRGWNDVTRTIAMSGMTTRHASSQLHSNLFGLLLQTGYRFDQGCWTLTPLTGMRYLCGALSNGIERGADSLDQLISVASRDSLSTHLGARLACRVAPRWRVEGYSQWEHEFLDTAGNGTMTFGGARTNFYTVRGVACERDGVRIGLATVAQWNDYLEFRFNYDTFLRSTFTSQQLTGGLSVAF